MSQSVAYFSPVVPVDLWSFCCSSCRDPVLGVLSARHLSVTHTHSHRTLATFPHKVKSWYVLMAKAHSRPDLTVHYRENLPLPA